MYDSAVTFTYGSVMAWTNTTARLLYERPVVANMAACTAGSLDPECVRLRGCYPCYCLGLANYSHNDDPTWQSLARLQCDPFIDQYSLHTWGIRIGISLVIAILNGLLKVVLKYLVGGCVWGGKGSGLRGEGSGSGGGGGGRAVH